jgi:tRNA/rRNA methyltransferase
MDTHHAGNVGAAARAIKTMGFDDLVLVSPHDPKVLNRQRTKEGASGATDVLQEARICDTLQQATDGTDFWCATGMPNDMYRARSTRRYFSPRVYFDQLIHADMHQLNHLSGSDDTNPAENENSQNQELRISFVFGNERLGMKEEDTDLCHVVLGIPTNPKFGSLNLASAVQLIAYDWRQAIGGFDDHRLSTESSAST